MKHLILAVAAVTAMTAHAQTASKNNTGPLPPAVQLAVTGGMKVEKKFEAAGGLTGWILSQGIGNNIVAFTPASGDVVVVGRMIDAKGQDLTRQYLEQHAPKPDYTEMWGELEKSSYTVAGTVKNPKSVIYVFKDPNCSFCHLAYKALQPYEEAGLQVRWVPVAFLAPDSMDKAAAMLNAKDGNAIVDELAADFGKKGKTYPKASAADKAKIEANGELMRKWGFQGTPAVIWKDKDGKVQAKPGMFRLSELPNITGLPEIPNNDPSLARFK